MRQLFVLCFICLALTSTTPAVADCAGKINALFHGGAWDPFVRENRRETTVIRHPDGKETPSSDVLWDGPIRSINCSPNGCFMAIGFAFWKGASFEGPWTGAGNTGSGDPEKFVRATNDRLAASVTEPECSGTKDLNGQSAVLYHFSSKPEPNKHGSWWGGRYSVWVSPDAKRILRIELADGIASWAPKPSKDVKVTTIVYDSSIKIKKPE